MDNLVALCFECGVYLQESFQICCMYVMCMCVRVYTCMYVHMQKLNLFINIRPLTRIIYVFEVDFAFFTDYVSCCFLYSLLSYRNITWTVEIRVGPEDSNRRFSEFVSKLSGTAFG
jgi:hypothetical protein